MKKIKEFVPTSRFEINFGSEVRKPFVIKLALFFGMIGRRQQ